MNRRSVVTLGVVLAIGAVAAYSYVRPQLWKWQMQIKEVPLSGATISYRDIGHGDPAVVIISGVAVPKTAYLDLQTRLSSKTRVITDDRPGIGDSTPNTEPRTLAVIDKDLAAFLRELDVPPPYVFIGHSWGGHIIRYFADQHPDEVAGLVFLDQPHEDWFDYIRRTWSKEEAETYFKSWTAANPAYAGTGLEEVVAYEENCRTVRAAPIPSDVPVLMFTTSNPGHFRKSAVGREEDQQNWIAMQTSLLAGAKDQKHFVNPELTHWPHQDRPEWVAGEISAFIDKLRGLETADPLSSSSLAPPGATAGAPASSP